jgi:prepilin-type processing-associated H-X9-DG protein
MIFVIKHGWFTRCKYKPIKADHVLMELQCRTRHGDAFTRTDLVALLGTSTLLLLLLLTGAWSTGDRSRQAVCFNHHRLLARAWLDYANDHAGKLVGNLDGGGVMSLSNSNLTWVLGWLDFLGGSPTGANTNTLYLTKYSPLAPYLDGDTRTFRCPADFSLSRGSQGSPRVRSYSMNGYLGRISSWTAGYRTMKQLGDIGPMTPSRLFVFIDEREDSINDGVLFCDMTGYAPRDPRFFTIIDFPAFWHGGGATLSFADGHVESWLWRDPRTIPQLKSGQSLALGIASPNNVDVARIQDITTRPR